MTAPLRVGIFDSGVGGLSVWRELARSSPVLDLIYLADHARCPYGLRSVQDIRAIAHQITAFFVSLHVDVVVVACNTASAAALHDLRQKFDLPIVGMEPAVKPAAAHTRSGHIGVVATQVTFQGQLFQSLIARFAQNVNVHTQVCPGWVERVEAGDLNGPETRRLVQSCLQPLLEADIDTLVLGCTHYPFLSPLIQEIVGPRVILIDPAPAVARQVRRVLALNLDQKSEEQMGHYSFYTTDDPNCFAQQLKHLIAWSGPVETPRWGI